VHEIWRNSQSIWRKQQSTGERIKEDISFSKKYRRTVAQKRICTHPLSKLEVISAFCGFADPRSGFLTVISLTVSISRAQPALGTSSSNVTKHQVKTYLIIAANKLSYCNISFSKNYKKNLAFINSTNRYCYNYTTDEVIWTKWMEKSVFYLTYTAK